MSRKHRLVLGLLTLLPVLMVLAGAFALLPLVLVPLLMVGPALYFRGSEPPPGPGGPDDGDGGGGGSRTPNPTSDSPSGSMPLPGARPGLLTRRPPLATQV